MWTLPNILTLSRILVIPALIASFYMSQPLGSHIAFALFALAGITDFFDGYLARRQKSVSKIGQFLDPIADKLMVATVLMMVIAVGWLDGIHIIAAILIMLREILISGLREYLGGQSVTVPVTNLAKWKTTVQMVALGALVWTKGAPDLGLPAYEVGIITLWVAALLTVQTGYNYMKVGIAHMIKGQD